MQATSILVFFMYVCMCMHVCVQAGVFNEAGSDDEFTDIVKFKQSERMYLSMNECVSMCIHGLVCVCTAGCMH